MRIARARCGQANEGRVVGGGSARCIHGVVAMTPRRRTHRCMIEPRQVDGGIKVGGCRLRLIGFVSLLSFYLFGAFLFHNLIGDPVYRPACTSLFFPISVTVTTACHLDVNMELFL